MKAPHIPKPKSFYTFRTGMTRTLVYINGEPVELLSKPMGAETRALHVTWNVELADDLMAYHNIDAEAELATILAHELNIEINNEIINAVREHNVNGNPILGR